MSKITKIVYYAFAVMALLFFIAAWCFIGDKQIATWLTACGCFCLIFSIWTWVDSKVNL